MPTGHPEVGHHDHHQVVMRAPDSDLQGQNLVAILTPSGVRMGLNFDLIRRSKLRHHEHQILSSGENLMLMGPSCSSYGLLMRP